MVLGQAIAIIRTRGWPEPYTYNVYAVNLAGKSPNLTSYTVCTPRFWPAWTYRMYTVYTYIYIYGSGQPTHDTHRGFVWKEHRSPQKGVFSFLTCAHTILFFISERLLLVSHLLLTQSSFLPFKSTATWRTTCPLVCALHPFRTSHMYTTSFVIPSLLLASPLIFTRATHPSSFLLFSLSPLWSSPEQHILCHSFSPPCFPFDLHQSNTISDEQQGVWEPPLTFGRHHVF